MGYIQQKERAAWGLGKYRNLSTNVVRQKSSVVQRGIGSVRVVPASS